MHQVNLKEQSSPLKNRPFGSNFHLCPSNLNDDKVVKQPWQVFEQAIKSNLTSIIKSRFGHFTMDRVFIVIFIVVSLIPSQVNSFMNLYLNRNETFRLLGE